ncbi:GntR family transcriptional regulator [Blastococcus mobilis]|uniref:DNA-binding transcriptional regulator, GntR family n=1 Tax=Blastococcus mobilis TaxID=1938746 RepID=A0A238Y2L1_9ACTN|nr:GntR family transcriptional regulator [Blastococcus mobilis]SNR65455.1 DNA-binding transcriptional regulator, GntR family [Blastococcus mobilis]
MDADVGTDGSAESAAASLSLPQFGQRRNLRQEIAVALRAALVTGEMRPGVVYSAPALAQKFGVSATPVREAMLDLAGEGLVEPVRNKGFRVAELSEQDLDEITYLRSLIEVPAVVDVASAMDDRMRPRAEALRPLARAIERLAEKGDLIAYVEADRRFHLALLDLTGNRHLVDLVANLRARSRLYGLQQLAERGELAQSAREHEEIVDLVLEGRSEAAGDLMRRHIRHVRGAWAGQKEPTA